jgi:hypothetical protein
MDMITYAALQKQIRESAGNGETATEVFHVQTTSVDAETHSISCSFDELFNAVESGKVIMFNARPSVVLSFTANRIRIAMLQKDGYEEWTVNKDGSAGYWSRAYVLHDEKCTAINMSSTDEQWVSAKAVYDFVHAYADSFAGGSSGGGEGGSGSSAAAPFIFDLVIGGDEYYEAYELPEGVTYNDLCNAYNARRQVFAHVVSKSGNFDLMVPLVGIAPFFGTELIDVNEYGHILQFSTQIVGQFCVFFNVFWDGWVNCDGSLDQLLEM